jgi:trimethylamine--corrinoid protein Co-methyltransferase
MQPKSTVQPRLNVLNRDQIERIHSDSLRILSSVGVRVDSQPAFELLARAAGPSSTDGRCVRLPSDLVEWALEVAPSKIEIYDRRGNLAFHLPDQARFGIGVTALYYQEPENDEVVPFARKHMGATVRLGSALSSYDVISTVGIVQDVPPQVSDLYATLEMTANTHKPLVLLVSADDAFPAVLDLLEHLHGDLSSRPFVVPYLNPITPLVINRGTADKMMTAIQRGLPLIYSNYGMAGASTPITPAAAMVLLNAELLAGLTLSQLIREGTPVTLGCLPAYFDMKGMGSFYDPKSYVIDLACAEMMAHYRLPHAGTSGSGMGWGGDIITAGHQWLNHLVSCVGQVGLVPFVGDNLGSKAFSPTIIAYANEVIAQARLFAQGFALDNEAIGLDDVGRMGPGGNFLMSALTLKHFRQAYYHSDIFPKLTLEAWQDRGSPRAGDVLRKYTLQLLDKLDPPDDHAEILARGETFIRTYMANLP